MFRPVGENPWNEVGAHPPRSATAFLRFSSQPDFRHGSLRMHPLHSFTKFLSVVEQGSRSDKFMHVRISRFSQNWGFGCHRCHSVLKHRRTAISPQRFILHSISALCLFIVVVLSLHSLRIYSPRLLGPHYLGRQSVAEESVDWICRAEFQTSQAPRSAP